MIGLDSEPTREQRQVIERHVNAALSLEGLGLGFRKVAEVVYQHHRRYAAPTNGWQPDYPSDDDLEQFLGKKAPRGPDIPLETRVPRVADVLDALLSDRSYRSALDLSQAVATIERERGGDFDPEVVAALVRLTKEDAQRLQRIAEEGRLKDERGLRLYFSDKRLTAGRLHTLLGKLADVYLPEGKALNRLAVKGLAFTNREAVLKLAGTAKDVEEPARLLELRKKEYEDYQEKRRNSGGLPDTELRGLQRHLRRRSNVSSGVSPQRQQGPLLALRAHDVAPPT